ncbi:MAG TPA: aminotransferase class V-fold PLP-dependent enzyme [Thermomicrobiales bacterium]|nr:aminotransferase class V-fold PLP-dependent enzyme [Thermomicrobiales bacterium]
MAITNASSEPRVTRDWLAELDIRPVINAAATLTALGGSLMPPEVRAAMDAGASHFVDLRELQRKVGERIAELTQNEAAYVASGAAAGIALAVAASMTGTDPARIDALPDTTGFEKNELIIQRVQRNGYDYSARMTGAKMVEVENSEEALEAAITDRTAAILWFAGGHFGVDALPIEQVIAIGKRRGVNVIVDAAAQIPKISNLWHFTRDLGADIAVFSGGKGLRGPQPSGLVLGRADLIDAVRANSSPNHSMGRPFKVGKEELFACLAAVEWSLAQDEDAVIAGYEETVQRWLDGVRDLPGVVAERGYPSEAGQPYGRAILTIEDDARLDRDALHDALWDRNPRIAVSKLGERQVALNPQTLEPGEAELVLTAIRELLS